MILPEFRNSISSFFNYLQCTKNISTHTKRAYSTDLNELLNFWQIKEEKEQQKFDLVTIIQHYLKFLAYTTVTPPTIARKYSCFSSFIKYLNKEQKTDLYINFARPLIRHKQPKLLSFEEIQILENLSSDLLTTQRPFRDQAIFQLLYATGMLTSEIIQLQTNHINFEAKTLLVDSLTKRRLINLDNKITQKLYNYLLYEHTKNTQILTFFLNHRNEPLTTRSIQRICISFSHYLKRTIIITPFILRYSYAWHQLQKGKSIQELNEILGHRTLVSTQRYFQLFNQKV